MKNYKHIFLAALAALGLVSCAQDEIVPDAATKTVSFAKSSITIVKKGDTQVVSVTANTDWTVSSDSEWIQVSPDFGTSATKSVTVTVDEENTTEETRSGKVVIVSTVDASQTDTLTVKQSASDASITISDVETLVTFLENASSYTEGEEVEVTADIDVEGAELTPATSFAGILLGNNHMIYNFTIASTYTTAGLILSNTGTIQDLIVGTKDGSTWDKVTTITFSGSDITATAIGLVAVNSGVMENVSNYASITFNATNTADVGIGGVAGRLGSASAKMTDCHNYGEVTMEGTLGYRGMLGGVLGFNDQTGPVVSDCVNHVDLIQSTQTAKEFTMGGVVGRTNAAMTIQNCKNQGNVQYTCTDTPGSYLHIAGIVGAVYYSPVIDNCTNTGTISSCINQVNRMGGIVGTLNTGGTVSNCTNEGSIIIEQTANANWQAAGGIVGFEEKCTESATGYITSCTNKGGVSVTVANTTTHANQVNAGGIIGITVSVTEITDNTNSGAVTLTNTGSSTSRAGGIAGWEKTTATTISGCQNTGAVSVTASASIAGGVVGESTVAASVIKENTNLGAITGTTAGSIAGVATSAMTSCAVGGIVNDTALTAENFESYIQGSGSGVPVSCYFPGSSAAEYISVSPVSLTFAAAGTGEEVTVSSNCSWTATSSADWLTVSATSGSETMQIMVYADENTTYDERTATISFVSQSDANTTATLTAVQAGKVDGLTDNKITSADDFKAFLVLAESALATDTYTLEADVDYTGQTFIPATSFAGTLDGQGHTITVSLESGDYQYFALIQTLTGTVKNLNVAGSITNKYAGNLEYAVAPIAATVDGGRVEGCVNNASITDASTSAGAYANVGGVIGYLKGDGATITNCTNNGKITLTNSCQTILGGVVAYGQTNATAPTLTLTNLVNTGDIEINHEGANWDYIGGVIGKMGASSNPFTLFTVSGCEYSGTMTIVKAPKIRGGGVFGSCGVSTDYDVSSNVFSGKIDLQSTEAVDRCIGGVGPGYSEANAIGTMSNCTFSGTINAVDGGNLYLGGIYGNNGSASVVIDNCKATSTSSISGYTAPKSIGVIAARPNKAGFTIKNCKIAGTVTSSDGTVITITADNIEDWMYKGSATTVDVTLTDNGYNAE